MSKTCNPDISCDLRPIVTQQPTVRGESGEPVGVVIVEVVCLENDENDLFAGLGTFIQGRLPAEKAPAVTALEKLTCKLRREGRKLGADAILSTSIKLVRGANAAGHKLLKMTAIGTAVVLPSE
jgi:uncharacterized protein YbjQ (UPF0145 family)